MWSKIETGYNCRRIFLFSHIEIVLFSFSKNFFHFRWNIQNLQSLKAFGEIVIDVKVVCCRLRILNAERIGLPLECHSLVGNKNSIFLHLNYAVGAPKAEDGKVFVRVCIVESMTRVEWFVKWNGELGSKRTRNKYAFHFWTPQHTLNKSEVWVSWHILLTTA